MVVEILCDVGFTTLFYVRRGVPFDRKVVMTTKWGSARADVYVCAP